MKKIILATMIFVMILLAYAQGVTIEQYSSELLTGIKSSINNIVQDAELRASEKNLASNIDSNKVSYSNAIDNVRTIGKEADRLLETINQLKGISKEIGKKKIGGGLESLKQVAREG